MENEIDYSKIKDGQCTHKGNLYDNEDRLIGPIPRIGDEDKVGEVSIKEEVKQEAEEKNVEQVKEDVEKKIEENPYDDWRLRDLEHWDVPKFQPELWSKLNKKVFPKDRWRINNLLPKEGYAIVAGISGEGKTWVCLEMAKAISSGTDFLGHTEFSVLKGNVLYLNLEMSESELQRRGRQLGFNEEDESLFILNSGSMNLGDPESGDTEWLLDYIKKKNISTVFVDTFRAAAGGIKEEKAEEVRKFFNQFASLKNSEVCMVFTEHFRKPSHFEGKIPKKEHLFASQDKVASVETLLMLQSQDDGETIHVYQRKNRIGREIPPFKMAMRDEVKEQTGQIRTVFTYEGEIETAEKKQDQAKDFILGYLEGGGKTRKEILQAAYQATKIGERNVSAALRELQTYNLLSVQKEGRNNFYTLVAERTGKEDDW